MTMRILEGFDYFTTDGASGEVILVRAGWASSNTSAQIEIPGRFGYGGALTVGINNGAGHNGLIKGWVGATSDVVFMSAGMYRNDSEGGNEGPQISCGEITSGTILHLCARLQGNGQVAVYRSDSSTSTEYRNVTWTRIGISDINTFNNFSWVHLEVKATIHASDGEVEVRLNGKTVVHLMNVRTKNNNGLAYCNSAGPGAGGNDDLTSYIDDFAAWDDEGSSNNDWLGTTRIKAQFAIADGSNIDSIIGGSAPAATHWQSVINKLADDTKYVYISNANVGDYDTYDMDPIITSPAVFALQTRIRARQDDATQLTIKAIVRSAGTDYEGLEWPTTETYNDFFDMWEVDPATSLGWSMTTANAIELGFKLESSA